MARLSPRGIADQVMSKINNEYDNLASLNIMVLGKTGVGKSTLINRIFEERMVEAGTGKPVTNSIVKVEQEGVPLVLYDTPGLELTGANDFEALSKQITKLIHEYFNDKIVGNEIHCILYCVSTASHRFEGAESDFLRGILDKTKEYNVPVIIVLTQSFSRSDAEEMKQVIEAENLPISAIIPVLADEYEFDEDIIIPPYGIDTLTEKMADILPDSIRNTFIALESANLALKTTRARVAVTTATITAAATGVLPIPIADSSIVIPDQIAMLVGISIAFGLRIDKETSSIISGTINAIGPTVFGKNLKYSLFKIIPGIGLVMSGTTIASVTYALGETYIKVLTNIYTGEIKKEEMETPETKKLISDMFMREMSSSAVKAKEVSNGGNAQ